MSAIAFALTLAACESTTPQDTQATTTTDVGMVDDGATTIGTGEDTGLATETMEEQTTAAEEAAAALETVFYFDFDKATLRPETREALDAQIARLRATSSPVRLEGHADERGTREYNLALGERRAKAIAQYMSAQGVAASRIEVVSYGEEKPVADGHDEESWQQNRRVELVE